MYFTSGSDRAFEQLMQTRPGADHFDSGEAGAPEDCGTCRFYRPHWKYQFCVYSGTETGGKKWLRHGYTSQRPCHLRAGRQGAAKDLAEPE